MTRTTRLNLSREPFDTAQPFIIFNELIEALEAGLLIRWSGIWAAGTYYKGDWVTHDDALYLANTETTEEPSDTATDWDLKFSGGTDIPLTTKGDILGWTTELARLAIGTDDYVLTADDSATLGFTWKALPAQSGGGMNAKYVTTNTTLVADDLLFSDSGLAHTLPASPTTGDKCSVWDVSNNASVNNITVSGNGNNIVNGLRSDTSCTIDLNNARCDFMYDGTNWVLSPIPQIQATGVTAPVKRKVFVEPSQLGTNGTTMGEASYQVALQFPSTGYPQGHFKVTLPDDWDGGLVSARVHWTPTTTGSGDVGWYVEAVSISESGGGDWIGETGVVLLGPVYQAAGGIADRLHTTDWGTPIQMVGDESPLSNVIFGRVQRQGDNASDTYGSNAECLGVEIEYTVRIPDVVGDNIDRQYIDADSDRIWPVNGVTKETDTSNSYHSGPYAYLKMPDSAQRFGYLNLKMHHKWDEGPIRVRFYWKSTITSGDVVWGFGTHSADDGESQVSTLANYGSVVDSAPSSASNLQISDWTSYANVSDSPTVDNGLVTLVTFRNGAAGTDTLIGDVRLLGIEIECRIN